MNLSQAVPELPVADLGVAVAYYRDNLGFSVAWLNEEGRIAGLSRGECTVFLREGRVVNPYVIWVFVEDVDAAFAALAENGAKITAEPENKPWGLRQFTLEDMDGHVLHLHHNF